MTRLSGIGITLYWSFVTEELFQQISLSAQECKSNRIGMNALRIDSNNRFVIDMDILSDKDIDFFWLHEIALLSQSVHVGIKQLFKQYWLYENIICPTFGSDIRILHENVQHIKYIVEYK